MAFKFDDKKDFEENLASFLDFMEGQDAHMGKILRAHIGQIMGASSDEERRAARAQFNLDVKPDLDALAVKPPPADDGA